MEDLPAFIVVGSGNTGAMAAQTLVEGGATVTMLDVGRRDETYAPIIPESDFISVRTSDPEQHRYFLGDAFEGIPSTSVTTGAQLTPPRAHVSSLVDRYLPLLSDSFRPQESLAYGGLGDAWGAGCCVFSDAELREAGLDPARMATAYQTVADRIGISGAKDDATPFTSAGLTGVQAAPALDETCGRLARRYRTKRRDLNRQGVFVGRPAMALLTEDMGDRRAYAYRDMDFYDDHEKSVYRPWITVDALKSDPRFRYVGGDARRALRGARRVRRGRVPRYAIGGAGAPSGTAAGARGGNARDRADRPAARRRGRLRRCRCCATRTRTCRVSSPRWSARASHRAG